MTAVFLKASVNQEDSSNGTLQHLGILKHLGISVFCHVHSCTPHIVTNVSLAWAQGSRGPAERWLEKMTSLAQCHWAAWWQSEGKQGGTAGWEDKNNTSVNFWLHLSAKGCMLCSPSRASLSRRVWQEELSLISPKTFVFVQEVRWTPRLTLFVLAASWNMCFCFKSVQRKMILVRGTQTECVISFKGTLTLTQLMKEMETQRQRQFQLVRVEAGGDSCQGDKSCEHEVWLLRHWCFFSFSI